MTMPASRGQLRRFSGSNLTAAFCSMCSNASPADWSGWSTLRSVHSSNHNPLQPPLQAWIFTSLTATSVIAVPQAGQFIVMTPSRGCSRYPTTLMAPPRAAQPAGRLARGSRTQSTAGLPESAASTRARRGSQGSCRGARRRSEEHTSELQSPCNLVCRLLLEKKKKQTHQDNYHPLDEHVYTTSCDSLTHVTPTP